jgi:Fervidolysin N-terminal prodomain
MSGNPSEMPCPPEVLEAIPFYPDGLAEAQRGSLEAHAAACDDCRRELALMQGVPAEEPAEVPDAERVWARVLQLVSAEAGEAKLHPERRAQAPPPAARGRWRRIAARPLPLAASIALALAFGTLGTAAGSLLLLRDRAPVYETASAPRDAGPSLDVVFRKDARAEEIQQALRAVDGSLVDGPSPLGVYHVALPAGADVASAAAALRSEAGHVAVFAEPPPR